MSNPISLLRLTFLTTSFQSLAKPNSAIADAIFRLFSNELREDHLLVYQIANNKITPVAVKGILEMMSKEHPKKEDSRYWQETILFLNERNPEFHFNENTLHLTIKEQLALAISYDFKDTVNEKVTELKKTSINALEDISVEDQHYYNNMLRMAILHNCETAIEKLLALGADPHHEDENQNTPLVLAVEKNSPFLVQILLGSGANPNHISHNNYTPLLSALLRDPSSFPIIKMLLDKGADACYKTPEGDTPLFFAAVADNAAIVELLLKYGANPNTNTPAIKDKSTPLHEAAKNGSIEITTLLLNAKADVNAKNQYDQIPLHLAVDNLDLKMVQFLLKEGSDCNSQDEVGNSSLHWAARKGNREMIQLLMPYANGFLKNGEGLTPFQLLEETNATLMS